MPGLTGRAEQAKALETYKKRLLEHREWEAKVRNMRMGMRDLNKEYDKTEDDLKALQSVGQIIGELLRQLDDERYIVKASSGPRYVVGCRNKVRQRGAQCRGAGYAERVGVAESDGARIGPRLPRRGEQCERAAAAPPRTNRDRQKCFSGEYLVTSGSCLHNTIFDPMARVIWGARCSWVCGGRGREASRGTPHPLGTLHSGGSSQRSSGGQFLSLADISAGRSRLGISAIRQRGPYQCVGSGMWGVGYRGTSLIRTPPPVGPYSSPMPRDLWCS